MSCQSFNLNGPKQVMNKTRTPEIDLPKNGSEIGGLLQHMDTGEKTSKQMGKDDDTSTSTNDFCEKNFE